MSTAEYLKVPEVASQLRVTRRTVYVAVQSGRLRAVRFGRGWRVRKQDLTDFLTRNTPTQAA